MDYHHLEIMPVPEPGSLGMMLAGLFWAVPIILCERGNSPENPVRRPFAMFGGRRPRGVTKVG